MEGRQAGHDEPTRTNGVGALPDASSDTAVMSVGSPEPDPEEPRDARRIPWLTVALGAAVAVAATIFVMLLLDDDRGTADDEPAAVTDETTTTAPTSTTEPTTTTTASTTTTTAPPTTTTTVPSLGSLADQVAADPDSYGDKGEDLLDRLQKVQREDDDDRAEEARKAIEKIIDWVDDGKLDADIAQQALVVLEPIALEDHDDD